MRKIASTQELVSQLNHLLDYTAQPNPSRVRLASELNRIARDLEGDTQGKVAAKEEQRDNSFGLGYYPLPRQLQNLGRFVEELDPSEFLSHKVYPKEGVHVITIKVSMKLDILKNDLEALINLVLS